jgi:hemerythrin superfamily protein
MEGSMKATLFLRRDHEQIRSLFSQYRHSKGNGDGKRGVLERIKRELIVHTQIEIELLFPELDFMTGESEKQMQTALQDDRQINKALSEMSQAGENEKQFEAKVAALIEKIDKHIDEEEVLFEEIRKNVSEQRLEELGLEMEDRKRLLTQIAA